MTDALPIVQLCRFELALLCRPKVVLTVSRVAANSVKEGLLPVIASLQIAGGLARRSYGVEYAKGKPPVAAAIIMKSTS